MSPNTPSRDSILARIKKNLPKGEYPLPSIPRFDVPGNPIVNFVSHLKGFDGDYRLFASRDEAISSLKESLSASSDRVSVSMVPEITGSTAVNDFPSSAAMHTIDICIAESPLAVAETGSVLVDNSTVGDPAAALFCTDLYILLDRNNLVDSLQDAYERIDLTANPYSAFFSGPSATADIEAVHVTGAQGEISLTVLMYNCTPADITAARDIAARLPQGTPLGQPDAPAIPLRRPADPASGHDSI